MHTNSPHKGNKIYYYAQSFFLKRVVVPKQKAGPLNYRAIKEYNRLVHEGFGVEMYKLKNGNACIDCYAKHGTLSRNRNTNK